MMTKEKVKPMVGPDDDGSEQIIVIDYDQKGVPCNVVTTNGSYQFADTPYGLQWCGGDCYVTDMKYSIGSLCEPVPPYKIWTADGVVLTKWVENDTYVPVSSAEALERGYKVIDELLDLTSLLDDWQREKGETTVNPFDVGENWTEGFAWCSVCETHVPDGSDYYCQHLFWDQELHGCGSNEVAADDHKESVFAVLEKTGLSGPLRRAMVNSDYNLRYYGSLFGTEGINVYLDKVNYGERFTDDLTEQQEEDMKIGVGWLGSLEPGETRQYELLTIKWIDEWLDARDVRAAVKRLKSKGLYIDVDKYGFIFGKEEDGEIFAFGPEGRFKQKNTDIEKIKRYESLEAMIEAAEVIVK